MGVQATRDRDACRSCLKMACGATMRNTLLRLFQSRDKLEDLET
jgi:hypothetical protein